MFDSHHPPGKAEKKTFHTGSELLHNEWAASLDLNNVIGINFIVEAMPPRSIQTSLSRICRPCLYRIISNPSSLKRSLAVSCKIVLREKSILTFSQRLTIGTGYQTSSSPQEELPIKKTAKVLTIHGDCDSDEE